VPLPTFGSPFLLHMEQLQIETFTPLSGASKENLTVWQ